jgi:hypothetical protein
MFRSVPILGFKTARLDDAKPPLEMDSFAYMTKDTLSEGKDVEETGSMVFPRILMWQLWYNEKSRARLKIRQGKLLLRK